jgi:hypothetical protein
LGNQVHFENGIFRILAGTEFCLELTPEPEPAQMSLAVNKSSNKKFQIKIENDEI